MLDSAIHLEASPVYHSYLFSKNEDYILMVQVDGNEGFPIQTHPSTNMLTQWPHKSLLQFDKL